MPVVANTEKNPIGTAHAGAQVRIRLVAALVGAAPGYVPASDYSIIGEYSTRTDGSGNWSVTLVANSLISPANTYYIADVTPKQGAAIRHMFSVPNTAGPFRVEDILTNPPANLPDLHQLDPIDAHAASAVSLAAVAGLAGDDVQEAVVNLVALDALKIPLTQRAAANGVATLDATTKIPVAQVPDLSGTYAPNASPTLTGTVTLNSRLIVKEGLLDVRLHGAVLDSSTNDQPAIQAAITAAALAPTGRYGRGILVPGQARTSSVLRIPAGAHGFNIAGWDNQTSGITNVNTDVFEFADTYDLSDLYLRDFNIVATAGHIFKVGGFDGTNERGIFLATFERLRLIQDNTAKAIFQMDRGLYLDNLVTSCQLQGTLAHTVPLWKCVTAAGGVNTNVFQGGRVNNSGMYVFHLEDSSGTSYVSGNKFRDINFETCNGGCIRLWSADSTIIEGCEAWDGGTTTQHLYDIDRSPTTPGLVSTNTSFRHVQRRGGSLGVGKKDIRATLAAGTTIDTCGPAGATFDFNGATGFLKNVPYGVVIQNRGSVVEMTQHSTLLTGTGATGSRPNAVFLLDGDQWFDATLRKPIFWDAGAVVWKDSQGVAV